MKRKLPAWIMVIIATASSWIITWLTGLGIDEVAKYFFGVWGVTDKTIAYAPGWIKTMAGSFAYIRETAQFIALGALALLLGRAFRLPSVKRGKKVGIGLLLGVSAAAATVIALFLTDAMRLGRAAPAFGVYIIFQLVTYASSAFGLGLMFAWLCPGILSGAKWRGDVWIPAIICAALTAFEYTPAAILNLALIAGICALLQINLGWGASFLFRLGLYAVLFVMTGSGGLYECYPAAHDWLSGEYAGPVAGYMLTVFLTTILFIITRRDVAGGDNGRIIAN